MGFPVDLFLDQNIKDEFLCSICQDVLQEPLMLEPCEHAFCQACIEEWQRRSDTCPVDRTLIEVLKKPPRLYTNLLNGLELYCRFKGAGCQTTLKLGDLVAHDESCYYNPANHRRCDGGCGLVLTQAQARTHNCVTYLQHELKNAKDELRKKDEELATLRRELGSLKQPLNGQSPPSSSFSSWINSVGVTLGSSSTSSPRHPFTIARMTRDGPTGRFQLQADAASSNNSAQPTVSVQAHVSTSTSAPTVNAAGAGGTGTSTPIAPATRPLADQSASSDTFQIAFERYRSRHLGHLANLAPSTTSGLSSAPNATASAPPAVTATTSRNAPCPLRFKISTRTSASTSSPSTSSTDPRLGTLLERVAALGGFPTYFRELRGEHQPSRGAVVAAAVSSATSGAVQSTSRASRFDAPCPARFKNARPPPPPSTTSSSNPNPSVSPRDQEPDSSSAFDRSSGSSRDRSSSSSSRRDHPGDREQRRSPRRHDRDHKRRRHH